MVRRTALQLLLSTLGLFAGLWVLRHQMVTSVGVDYATAWQIGVERGWLQDLCVACVPAVLAALTAVTTRLGYWLPWAVGSSAVWGLGVANLLFFRYFGAPLEAWNIAEHVGDVWTIRHVVTDMLSPLVVVPAVLILVGGIWTVRRQRRIGPEQRRALLRGATGLTALAAFAGGAAVSLAPTALMAGSAIGENVLFELVREAAVDASPQEALHTELQRFGLSDVVRLEPRFAGAPTARLAALRDWQDGPGALSPRVGAAASEAGLLRPLSHSQEQTRAARAHLGLPEDSPPNVIVLYLESVRAFEVQHPEIGPALFPELHRVLAKHGVVFNTAYSSAMAAGLTARGQFSTSCSMLPNFGAAATFIAHPEVRVRCMADLASEAGFETLWISGGPMQFHNKFVFERLHGVRNFYDEEHFQRVPIENVPYEGCGFPDKDLLERSMALLEQAKRPFFASILTISTHVPYSQVPEAPVPEALKKLFEQQGSGLETADGQNYAAYLSRLRYLDQSVGVFFDRFFASDLADDTLVVVLGDHGIAIESPLPSSSPQRIEQRARVPMALVSAELQNGETRSYPVHQVDVAPTVAEIAGWQGDVTWVGRSMLHGGTPWVFYSRAELHYRLGDRICYAVPGSPRGCYELSPGTDPLFDALGPPDLPRRAHDAFFLGLALETRHAITRNQLALRGPQ